MTINSSSVCSFIVAGGLGQRMMLHKSKPLITVNEKALLQYSIESQIKAGIEKIYIYYNYISFKEELVDITKKFNSAHLKLCADYESTFLVLFNNLPSFAQKIMFCYAHAPRPVSHISKILSSGKDLVVSGYKSSTMRIPIPYLNGIYIEPPYLIKRELIERTKCDNWRDFFKENKHCLVINVDGPSEFNYPDEFINYTKYLEKMARDEL